MSNVFKIVAFAVVVFIGTTLYFSESGKMDSQQELANLSRQAGYCDAIQDNALPAPKQCADAVSKERRERLMHEFMVK